MFKRIGLRSRISLILVFFVVLVALIDWYRYAIDCSGSLCSYSGGLVTELIGILLTVVIVDFMREIRDKKLNRTSVEMAWLLVHRKYLEFQKYLFCITHPIDMSFNPDDLVSSFSFSDLKNIFNPTKYIGDDFQKGAFEHFVRAKDDLYDAFLFFHSTVSQNLFPELYKRSGSLIRSLSDRDCRQGIILSFPLVYIQNDGAKTFLINPDYIRLFDDFEEKTHRGEVEVSNFITPYQVFYYKTLSILGQRSEFKRETHKVLGY